MVLYAASAIERCLFIQCKHHMVGLMLLSEKHESLDFDLSMDIKSYSFKIQLIDLSLVSIFILCAFEGEDRC